MRVHQINNIMDQLKEFPGEILQLNSPADENDMQAFVKEMNLPLPQDYWQLIQRTNGFSLSGTEVYGLHSLLANYQFEHFEVSNPMHPHLIPFSPDGYGNHYCFDTNTMKNDICNIVFWQYDAAYTEKIIPEITNDSFLNWMQEVVINWTKDDNE